LNALSLFLPCAAGVESWLLSEVQTLLGADAHEARAHRAGVTLRASWRDVLRLNLHSRLAQRVLVQLRQGRYAQEQDLYDCDARRGLGELVHAEAAFQD